MKKELNRTEKALAEALPYWCCKKVQRVLGGKGVMMARSERRQIIDWMSARVQARAKPQQLWACLRARFSIGNSPGKLNRKTGEWSPHNKLIEEERPRVLSLANSDEFTNRVLHQIVPILVERGDYIASESSFYRILKAENQLTHLHPSCVPNGMRLKTKRHKI